MMRCLRTLSFFGLCFSILSLLSLQASAQKVTLQAKNISIEQVFSAVRKQTGYEVLYSSGDLEEQEKLDVRFKNADLEEVLRYCLKHQQLDFSFDEKTIIIKRIKLQNTVSGANTLQYISVKGKVTDEQGRPLPGAYIVEQKTSRKVISNQDGDFYFRQLEASGILEIRFVGYQLKAVPLKGADFPLSIRMEPDFGKLAEVTVISTGYQRIQTDKVTGAVSTINNKSYETPLITGDLMSGLENKLSGLAFNRNIGVDQNVLFQVRGKSTIRADSGPLIVLDGYPTELYLNEINPNEIASVSLLKDAASSAIYGIRSANGVLVIDRKKGILGRPEIKFRTTFSGTAREDYSTYRLADQNTRKDFFIGLNELSKYPPKDYFMSFPVLYPTGIEPLMYFNAHLITEAEMQQRMNSSYAYNNAEDYGKFFEQNRMSRGYDLSVSGGADKIRYFLSSNFTDRQEGQLKSGAQSFLLSGRAAYHFNERLSLSVSADLMRNQSKSVPVPDFMSVAAFEPFLDPSGKPAPVSVNSWLNPLFNATSVAHGFYDNLYYPLQEMEEVKNLYNSNSQRLSTHLGYKILKGLSLSIGGAHEFRKEDRHHYASDNSAEVRQYRNLYALESAGGILDLIPKGGLHVLYKTGTSNTTIRAQTDYEKEIGSGHFLQAVAGIELRRIAYNIENSFGFGEKQMDVDYSAIFDNDRAQFNASFPQNPGFNIAGLQARLFRDQRYVSNYLNGIYTFRSRYSLSASFVIEQTNLYNTDKKFRYDPLWSLGAGWNLEKESFMTGLSWLNHLKVRMSVGTRGNISVLSAPGVLAARSYNHYPASAPASLEIQQLQNSQLSWEKTTSTNLGLDFQFWDRLSGSIDYYRKTSRRLMSTARIDPTKGADFAQANVGNISNNGIELTLNASWLSGLKKLQWNSGIVFSYNSSKISGLAVDGLYPGPYYLSNSLDANYIPGYPVKPIFAYPSAGLNERGLPLVFDKNGQAKRLGYADDKGLQGLVYLGSGLPSSTIGISNRFDFGPFYLYMMVDLYAGFKTRIPAPNPAAMRPLAGSEQYFRKPGDEAFTNVIGYYNSLEYNYVLDPYVYNNADRYVVNGSYLLLRELTLSYKFGSALLEGSGVKNIEIRTQASNLFSRGFNRYNYRVAAGDFSRQKLIPTFSLGLTVTL